MIVAPCQVVDKVQFWYLAQMVEGPYVESSTWGSDNKLLRKAVSDKQLFYLITHLLATISAGTDVSMMPEKTESSIGWLRGCKKEVHYYYYHISHYKNNCRTMHLTSRFYSSFTTMHK